MPYDNFKDVNLDLMYPKYYSRLFDAIVLCNNKGIVYAATSGTRFWSEQAKLRKNYLDRLALEAEEKQGTISETGRLRLKAIRFAGGGKASPPGFSCHNYGIGCDFVRIINGKKTYGKKGEEEETFGTLRDALVAVGLASGAKYTDWPHAEIPGLRTATQLQPLYGIYKFTPGDEVAKLKAGFKWLDSNVDF